MICKLVFGGSNVLKPHVRDLPHQAGLNVEDIAARVSPSSAFDPGTTSQPLQRLLRDGHQHTWYTLGATDLVHQTERGSRPGSPLPDVALKSVWPWS